MAADPALDALLTLRATLVATDDWLRHAIQRTDDIETFRHQGYSWQQVLATEDRPLMTDLVNRQIALLAEVTSRFRREEARCLDDEGVKTEEIADIFGVSVAHVEAMLAHSQSEG
jgi:hypothetical protein